MDEVLLEERHEGLLVLTMNRPERRNALDPELTLALRDAVLAAAHDEAVRAVVLTGAGGHFCVGGDVKAMAAGRGRDMGAGAHIHALRDRMEVSRVLHDMAKPTIALIEGSAAGAGLSMALACDLRIAAEDARLTTAFARVGLSGDYGGTWFLTRILGSARARELYLTSPVLTGAEAARIGLVTRAPPAGQVREDAMALASSLAAGPTRAYAGIKDNIAAAEAGGLADCLDREARNFVACSRTDDHREAAEAFVAKRTPVFHGR